MEPAPLPALAGLTIAPPNFAEPGGMANAAAFQAVFRESLDKVQPGGPADVTADLKAFGQGFIDLERKTQIERYNMMSAFMPTQPSASSAYGQPRQGQSERGYFENTGGPSQSASGDRLSPAARPIYSDATGQAAPGVIQSALGLPDNTDLQQIDFTKEIRGLTTKLNGVIETVKQRIAEPAPTTVEETMKRNSEIQGLIRMGDDLSNQRSMMATLHIAAFQEFRTKILVAFEHVTGSMKKLNEIFNSLKQGS